MPDERENLEVDMVGGWFSALLPNGEGFLMDREQAASLRDQLNDYLAGDVYAPSPMHTLAVMGAEAAGVPPETTK